MTGEGESGSYEDDTVQAFSPPNQQSSGVRREVDAIEQQLGAANDRRDRDYTRNIQDWLGGQEDGEYSGRRVPDDWDDDWNLSANQQIEKFQNEGMDSNQQSKAYEYEILLKARYQQEHRFSIRSLFGSGDGKSSEDKFAEREWDLGYNLPSWMLRGIIKQPNMAKEILRAKTTEAEANKIINLVKGQYQLFQAEQRLQQLQRTIDQLRRLGADRNQIERMKHKLDIPDKLKLDKHLPAYLYKQIRANRKQLPRLNRITEGKFLFKLLPQIDRGGFDRDRDYRLSSKGWVMSYLPGESTRGDLEETAKRPRFLYRSAEQQEHNPIRPTSLQEALSTLPFSVEDPLLQHSTKIHPFIYNKEVEIAKLHNLAKSILHTPSLLVSTTLGNLSTLLTGNNPFSPEQRYQLFKVTVGDIKIDGKLVTISERQASRERVRGLGGSTKAQKVKVDGVGSSASQGQNTGERDSASRSTEVVTESRSSGRGVESSGRGSNNESNNESNHVSDTDRYQGLLASQRIRQHNLSRWGHPHQNNQSSDGTSSTSSSGSSSDEDQSQDPQTATDKPPPYSSESFAGSLGNEVLSRDDRTIRSGNINSSSGVTTPESRDETGKTDLFQLSQSSHDTHDPQKPLESRINQLQDTIRQNIDYLNDIEQQIKLRSRFVETDLKTIPDFHQRLQNSDSRSVDPEIRQKQIEGLQEAFKDNRANLFELERIQHSTLKTMERDLGELTDLFGSDPDPAGQIDDKSKMIEKLQNGFGLLRHKISALMEQSHDLTSRSLDKTDPKISRDDDSRDHLRELVAEYSKAHSQMSEVTRQHGQVLGDTMLEQVSAGKVLPQKEKPGKPDDGLENTGDSKPVDEDLTSQSPNHDHQIDTLLDRLYSTKEELEASTQSHKPEEQSEPAIFVDEHRDWVKQQLNVKGDLMTAVRSEDRKDLDSEHTAVSTHRQQMIIRSEHPLENARLRWIREQIQIGQELEDGLIPETTGRRDYKGISGISSKGSHETGTKERSSHLEILRRITTSLDQVGAAEPRSTRDGSSGDEVGSRRIVKLRDMAGKLSDLPETLEEPETDTADDSETRWEKKGQEYLDWYHKIVWAGPDWLKGSVESTEDTPVESPVDKQQGTSRDHLQNETSKEERERRDDFKHSDPEEEGQQDPEVDRPIAVEMDYGIWERLTTRGRRSFNPVPEELMRPPEYVAGGEKEKETNGTGQLKDTSPELDKAAEFRYKPGQEITTSAPSNPSLLKHFNDAFRKRYGPGSSSFLVDPAELLTKPWLVPIEATDWYLDQLQSLIQWHLQYNHRYKKRITSLFEGTDSKSKTQSQSQTQYLDQFQDHDHRNRIKDNIQDLTRADDGREELAEQKTGNDQTDGTERVSQNEEAIDVIQEPVETVNPEIAELITTAEEADLLFVLILRLIEQHSDISLEELLDNLEISITTYGSIIAHGLKKLQLRLPDPAIRSRDLRKWKVDAPIWRILRLIKICSDLKFGADEAEQIFKLDTRYFERYLPLVEDLPPFWSIKSMEQLDDQIQSYKTRDESRQRGKPDRLLAHIYKIMLLQEMLRDSPPPLSYEQQRLQRYWMDVIHENEDDEDENKSGSKNREEIARFQQLSRLALSVTADRSGFSSSGSGNSKEGAGNRFYGSSLGKNGKDTQKSDYEQTIQKLQDLLYGPTEETGSDTGNGSSDIVTDATQKVQSDLQSDPPRGQPQWASLITDESLQDLIDDTLAEQVRHDIRAVVTSYNSDSSVMKDIMTTLKVVEEIIKNPNLNDLIDRIVRGEVDSPDQLRGNQYHGLVFISTIYQVLGDLSPEISIAGIAKFFDGTMTASTIPEFIASVLSETVISGRALHEEFFGEVRGKNNEDNREEDQSEPSGQYNQPDQSDQSDQFDQNEPDNGQDKDDNSEINTDPNDIIIDTKLQGNLGELFALHGKVIRVVEMLARSRHLRSRSYKEIRSFVLSSTVINKTPNGIDIMIIIDQAQFDTPITSPRFKFYTVEVKTGSTYRVFASSKRGTSTAQMGIDYITKFNAFRGQLQSYLNRFPTIGEGTAPMSETDFDEFIRQLSAEFLRHIKLAMIEVDDPDEYRDNIYQFVSMSHHFKTLDISGDANNSYQVNEILLTYDRRRLRAGASNIPPKGIVIPTHGLEQVFVYRQERRTVVVGKGRKQEEFDVGVGIVELDIDGREFDAIRFDSRTVSKDEDRQQMIRKQLRAQGHIVIDQALCNGPSTVSTKNQVFDSLKVLREISPEGRYGIVDRDGNWIYLQNVGEELPTDPSWILFNRFNRLAADGTTDPARADRFWGYTKARLDGNKDKLEGGMGYIGSIYRPEEIDSSLMPVVGLLHDFGMRATSISRSGSKASRSDRDGIRQGRSQFMILYGMQQRLRKILDPELHELANLDHFVDGFDEVEVVKNMIIERLTLIRDSLCDVIAPTYQDDMVDRIDNPKNYTKFIHPDAIEWIDDEPWVRVGNYSKYYNLDPDEIIRRMNLDPSSDDYIKNRLILLENADFHTFEDPIVPVPNDKFTYSSAGMNWKKTISTRIDAYSKVVELLNDLQDGTFDDELSASASILISGQSVPNRLDAISFHISSWEKNILNKINKYQNFENESKISKIESRELTDLLDIWNSYNRSLMNHITSPNNYEKIIGASMFIIRYYTWMMDHSYREYLKVRLLHSREKLNDGISNIVNNLNSQVIMGDNRSASLWMLITSNNYRKGILKGKNRSSIDFGTSEFCGIIFDEDIRSKAPDYWYLEDNEYRFNIDEFLIDIMKIIDNYTHVPGNTITVPGSGNLLDLFELFGSQTSVDKIWSKLFDHILHLKAFADGDLSQNLLNSLSEFLLRYY